MAYAILRIKKLKHAQLAAAAAHVARSRPTPNADPERAIETLVGADPEADVSRLLPERWRRDATVAVEIMLSASPEYFRPHDAGAAGTWGEKRMRLWSTLALDWLERRYRTNLAHASLHLDEATPHIHSFVVPRTERGGLSARDLFGPAQLREIQTAYAKAMKPIGLSRGIRGSRARHESIARYYGRVNRGERAVSILSDPFGTPPRVDEPAMGDRLNPKLYAERAASRAWDAGFRAGARAQAEALRAIVAKASEFDAVRRRLKKREAALEDIRSRAEMLRQVPLRKIFIALGCTTGDNAGLNWMTEAGRITVNRENAMQWYNHELHRGGGGAIDLTMHLGQWNFRQAVAWLGARFGGDVALSSARAWAAQEVDKVAAPALELSPPSEVPQPCAEAKDHIREYLRRLYIPQKLIDTAFEHGHVFGSRHGPYTNAVFVRRAYLGGPVAGAEIYGVTDTRYRGMRGRGVFFLGRDQCRELAVCTNAVDALSYAALHDRSGLMVCAAADADTGIQIARRLATEGVSIVAAYSCDEIGDRLAHRLIKAIPEATRYDPPGAQSWNDLLIIRNLADRLEPAGVENAADSEPEENTLFLRIGHRWIRINQPETSVITDHEEFFAVNDPALDESIRFAVRVAAARWARVKACGSDEFRRRAWHQAIELGIEIDGYQPSTQEKVWAEAALLKNSITPGLQARRQTVGVNRSRSASRRSK